MKHFLLLTFLALFCFGVNAQTQTRTSSPNFDALIQKANSIGAQSGSVYDFFTKQEVAQLQYYYSLENTLKVNLGQPTFGTDGIDELITRAYGWEAFSASFAKFNLSTPNSISAVGPGMGSEYAGFISPTDPNLAYSATDTGNFYSVNKLTGAYTYLGNLGVFDFSGMAVNPVNGNVYGITTTALYQINPTTPSATFIGNLGSGITLAIALAIDGSGNAYTYDVATDLLYSVNLATGSATSIGSIGFDANFAQGMDWDANTNQIYMTAFNNTLFRGELRSVNTATGSSTLIGPLGPSDRDFCWVSFVTEDDGAPSEGNCDLDGDTTGGDIWDRPLQDGSGMSSVGVGVRYNVYGPFTVDASGTYVIHSTQNGGWDGMIFVYQNNFDPNAPLSNFLAGNDDFGGIGNSEISTTLNTGVNYYYITTGFNPSDYGPYVTTINGPGNVSCLGGGGSGCEWTVTLDIPGFGDEISWELRDAGGVILSAGIYTSGTYTHSITAEGPLTFYIETMGVWNDNQVDYTVSNGTEVLVSGSLLGGEEATYTDLNCEETEEPEDGCFTAPDGQYPSTTFTPACLGITEVITSIGWLSEYSMVNVTSGQEYTFSTDVPTAFITIADAGGTTAYATGTASVTWTATVTGPVRFYTHENDDCLTSQNWVVRMVQCGEPIVIEEPNFPCFQGDGLASNGPEDGLNISSATNFRTADDFIVGAGDTFTVQQVRFNVLALSNIVNVDFEFRADNAGSPGSLVHSVSMTPSDSRIVGSGFGYNLYEVTFDFASPYTFTEGTYWMVPITTDAGGNGGIYWESSSTGSNGAYAVMSEDGGSTWATYPSNFQQIFFISGECDAETADPCSVEYDGTIQNGLGNLQTLIIANDFPVAANTEMALQKVTLNIFGNISDISVYVYDGNFGMPESEIASFANIAPDSQTLVGSAFGFNVYEVVVTLPTEVELSGGASGNMYWIGVGTTIGSEAVSNFWEMADAITNELAMVSSDGGASWQANTFNQDGAFIVEGVCSTLGLDDLTSFDFAYYPNPVKDVLNISTQKGIESVSAFNLAGQQVMSKVNVTNGQVNLSALPAGTYVFRVVLQGGQVETFKIIKK